MKVLILSFSANKVNEDSYIPNKKGLTFACVDECINELDKKNIQSKHICMNYKNIKKCMACGKRGWGICLEEHKCIIDDDFNEIYNIMKEYDEYIFVTPVYFWEMSESAKTFFDRLKRCDAFNDNSKIKGKKFISKVRAELLIWMAETVRDTLISSILVQVEVEMVQKIHYKHLIH